MTSISSLQKSKLCFVSIMPLPHSGSFARLLLGVMAETKHVKSYFIVEIMSIISLGIKFTNS